jgi:transcriptional regulator with XRE-family HTH domain
MSSTPEGEPGTLARRLERLFATAHPPWRGPYTTKEAAAAINEAAGTQVISYNYLYQLRRGTKTEPGHSRLAAIARFFGVPVSYFTDDENAAARAVEQLEEREVAAALRDQGVRDVAFRAAGLSPGSLAAILSVIDNARRLEGLPPVGAGDQPRS